LQNRAEWTVFIDIDEGVYVSLDYCADSEAPDTGPIEKNGNLYVPFSSYADYELRILTGHDLAILPLGPWTLDESITAISMSIRLTHE
jgi:hypothetical protein